MRGMFFTGILQKCGKIEDRRIMKTEQDQNCIAIDVETTGLSAGIDEIIEIGAVKLEAGALTEVYKSLVCPRHGLPSRITEITGITKELLVEARPIEEVLPEFLAFAGELPLLGHNLPFDYSFIKAACSKQNISFERKGIDTLRLARIFHPSLEKKTLSAMAEFYGIDSGHSHRACDDAITCAGIYLKMLEAFGGDPGKEVLFLPQVMQVKIKKSEPATLKQKKYLLDLLKYHRIEEVSVEHITKSQASKIIDFLRSGQTAEAKAMLQAPFMH